MTKRATHPIAFPAQNGLIPEPTGETRILTERLSFQTTKDTQFLDITDWVAELVLRNRMQDGVVHVQSLHTTSAVFLNEWQQALLEDFQLLLERLAPNDIPWRHNDPEHSDCERGNATAHLRAALLGPSVGVQVCSGKLALGTWQSIIFAEFDGPRERSVLVRLAGRVASAG